jgi:hypothetical protein
MTRFGSPLSMRHAAPPQPSSSSFNSTGGREAVAAELAALRAGAPGSRERLVEDLAALEHEQWMTWAKTILASERFLTPERRRRWEGLFLPYDLLAEDVKEHDRAWARRVLAIMDVR